MVIFHGKMLVHQRVNSIISRVSGFFSPEKITMFLKCPIVMFTNLAIRWGAPIRWLVTSEKIDIT